MPPYFSLISAFSTRIQHCLWRLRHTGGMLGHTHELARSPYCSRKRFILSFRFALAEDM